MAPVAMKPAAQIEIITYAPTEFYHCQHCEIVWNYLDFGHKLHAEQRNAGQLPPDLLAQYTVISDWVQSSFQRYGERLTIKVVDAVSVEGFLKSIRYRSRHFPVFVIDGTERIEGFVPAELDHALERRLCVGAAT